MLMTALARKPAHVAQFLGVHAGTVPPSRFFAPDNLAAIFA
jgi:hypothetical protein